MSIYDSAGFDQWGFTREGKDAAGVARPTEHPGGLRPPARPAVLGPEPANPAAALQAQLEEHDVIDKPKRSKADHAAHLAGRPRAGNDPEPPERVGASTGGASATGVPQGADPVGPGSGGLGGPTFPTPAQQEAQAKASAKTAPEPVPSSTTGARVDAPTDKPTPRSEKKAGK